MTRQTPVSPDVSRVVDRELVHSLQTFRDDLSRRTAALKPEHARRQILGTGAAANDVWNRVWEPSLGTVPERLVGVAADAFGAAGGPLTTDAAIALADLVAQKLDEFTVGLSREGTALFPHGHYTGLLNELMPRLKAQARASLERRAERSAIRGANRLDVLVDARSRQSFDDDLAEAMASGRPFAVLFMDLDNFKFLNDRHGHAEGDQALRNFANVAARALGNRATFYRRSGDEFLALALNASASDADALLRDVMEAAAAPQALTPHPVPMAVSVGKAMWDPTGAMTAEDLLRGADAAMYAAKRRKKALLPYYIREVNPLARKVATEQLPSWEAALFSMVLADEVALHSALLADQERTRAQTVRPPIDDLPQLIAWLTNHFQEVMALGPELEQVMNSEVPRAFGPDGEPGNCRDVIETAKRLGDLDRRAIAWALALRELPVGARFERLMIAGERLVDDFIRKMREFSDELAAQVAAHPPGPRPEGTAPQQVKIFLRVTVPPEALSAFIAELRALEAS